MRQNLGDVRLFLPHFCTFVRILLHSGRKLKVTGVLRPRRREGHHRAAHSHAVQKEKI